MDSKEYFEAYVKFADSTASAVSKNDKLFFERQEELANWLNGNYTRFDMAIAGLVGEAGEAADLWKKLKFQNKELNDEQRQKIVSELGDVCWYLAQASMALGISLEDIINQNIEKLKARHPQGFSEAYMKNK